MASTPLLLNPEEFRFSPLFATKKEINHWNRQRFEMQQLDAICEYRPEQGLIYGYKDTSPQEFWVRGHIPGNPLFPGVLMAEVAAQLCSFYYMYQTQGTHFFGFGGLDRVKFRGAVKTGQRFVVVARNKELRTRRAVFETQGFTDKTLVFEGEITGVLMR
jgi:3-hydroxyacyl-[acyl-carrier-protein] dehydratase